MTIDPPYYPGSDRTSQRFDRDHPGSPLSRIEKFIWHSTETAIWPGYDGGSKAPHMTGLPDWGHQRIRWRAHFPATMSSRALRNPPGGVETNRAGVFQVELIGTCDPAAHRRFPGRLYLPEAPAWYLTELARLAAWGHIHWGVPLIAPRFLAYPASAGLHNGVRLSGPAWDGVRGHLGHQHVPENTHGDPGDLDMAAVMTDAEAIVSGAKPPEEKDMPTPLTNADADLVIQRLLSPVTQAAQVELTAAAAAAMSTPGIPRAAGDKVSFLYLLLWGGPGLRTALAQLENLTGDLETLVEASPESVQEAFTEGVTQLRAELAKLRIMITSS